MLIVEDDAAAAEALRQYLSEIDVEVLTVETVDDALHALRWGLFALALVDLVLPGKDGRELLREMAKDPSLRGVPVIIISGQNAVLPEGAVAFLRKPVDPRELLALVHRYLQPGTLASG